MAERHHYVPLTLLRNFATNGKLWIYDKHLSKAFHTNIKNAFVEGNYNTVDIGGGLTLEAEEIFTRAESAAAPILQNILRKESVKHLGIEDKAQLAIFVMIQHLRSKQSRRNFSLLREHMQARFPELPQSNYNVPGVSDLEMDKYVSLEFTVQNLSPLAQHLVDKDLVLVENRTRKRFWISDHPSILHNDKPRGHSSNLGLGVPGIQIYLPISPNYAIAFFCPTIKQELKLGIEKAIKTKSNLVAKFLRAGRLGEIEKLVLADLEQKKCSLESYYNRINDAQKIESNIDNVTFHNSGQVLSAYRFIGSDKNEFDLAIDMIKKEPNIRKPNHLGFG